MLIVMPIYEYKCKACARLTSQFVRSAANEKAPACQHCGGKTARALSRFAMGKSASQVREQFGSAPRSMDDYSDPRQIGRWVEDKFDEYGMDIPDQAREMIDAARDGELPDAVKDL
jgi:putative FmdB family regulatory protein